MVHHLVMLWRDKRAWLGYNVVMDGSQDALPGWAAKLQELLRRRDLTQAELLRNLKQMANCEGLTANSLSRYMQGKVKPGRNYQNAIATQLGVAVGEIWPDRLPRSSRSNSGVTLSEFDFNVETLGFFRITVWNQIHQLRPENIGATRVVARDWDQDWIEDRDLYSRTLIAEGEKGGSDCPSLVSWMLDDWESPESTKLRLTVTRSHYSRYAAMREISRQNPSMWKVVASRIEQQGTAELVRTAPLSNIACNVTVVSADNFVLLMKRSSGARVWPRYWQAGPHETMNWPTFAASGNRGGVHENCLELAERALQEEVGLGPRDYHRVIFSWFGMYIPEATAYFFGHVRTHLTRGEIVAKLRESHSSFETEEVDWLPLRKSSIEAVLDTWRRGSVVENVDPFGKKYMPFVVMSLTELWRVRNVLVDD